MIFLKLVSQLQLENWHENFLEEYMCTEQTNNNASIDICKSIMIYYKYDTQRWTNSLTLLLSPDAHELILIPGYHK